MKYVGVSTPAWTILGRPEEKPPVVDETQPEPAIVDADLLSRRHLYPRQPTTVFVTPQPRPKSQEDQPAEPQSPKRPEPARPKKTKKDTFAKEDRFKMKNVPSGPGPGYYQADLNKKIHESMNNFSFGYKLDTPVDPKQPEEGADPEPITGLYYPLYKHRELGRSISFPKAPKDHILPLQVKKKDEKGNTVIKELPMPTELPGPGFYDIKTLPGNPTSRKGTFGKPKKEKAPRKDDPQADLDDEAGKPYEINVVQHTIGYKVQKIKEQIDLRNSRPLSLPKTKKLVEGEGEKDEGPIFTSPLFEYKPVGPKWKFGSGLRPELNHVSQTNIGPGEYFNMTHNPHRRKPAQVKSFPSLPKNTFGSQNKLFGEEKRRRDEVDKQKREREEFAVKVQEKKLFSGPSFSFRGKFDHHGYKDAYRMPGPGQYDFEAYAGLGDPTKGAKFGTSTRPALAAVGQVLGPGSYEIDRSLISSVGIKFPKAARRPMNNGTDLDIELGPGQYNIASTIPDLQYHEKQKILQQSPSAFI